MDNIRLALARLIRKPARSIMIMTGVAVGVFSIVVINGVSDSGREVIAAQLDTMGLYGMSVKFDQSSDMYFTEKDINSITQNIEGIKAITPISADYKSVTVNDETTDCVIWGVNDRADAAMNLNITHGEMLSRTDYYDSTAVCLVTEDFADKFFLSPAAAVGRNISVSYSSRKVDFTIKGVIKAGSEGLSTALSEYVPAFIYVPNTTHTTCNGKNMTQRLAIKTYEEFDENSVAQKIVRYLNVSYNGQGGFAIENLNDKKDSFDGVLSTVTDVLSAIGGISLFVSGISIMTVMMITVKERTREIGIKKSIGAQDGHILAEFLTEAVIISGVGSIVGIVCAALIMGLAGNITSIDISINVLEYLSTSVLAIVIGVIFSLVPALSAARLDPVKAFKMD